MYTVCVDNVEHFDGQINFWILFDHTKDKDWINKEQVNHEICRKVLCQNHFLDWNEYFINRIYMKEGKE